MQHCKNNDYVCQKVMLLNVKISKSQYEILSIEKIYAKKKCICISSSVVGLGCLIELFKASFSVTLCSFIYSTTC